MRFGKQTSIPTAEQSLRGRTETMSVPSAHYVNGHSLVGPWRG